MNQDIENIIKKKHNELFKIDFNLDYNTKLNLQRAILDSLADEVLKVFEEEKYGLLKKYSQWLEKHSYMDCDWWAEIPCSVDRFLEELYLSPNKENENNE